MVALVNKDASTPLLLSLAPASSRGVPLNWYISAYVSNNARYPNVTSPAAPRPPIQPHGGTDTYTLSLRFGPANTTAPSLAQDIFDTFAQTWPMQTQGLADRRPIASENLCGSAPVIAPPNNPRNYNLFQCPTDISTPAGRAAFRVCLLQRADADIVRLKSLNAQGRCCVGFRRQRIF